MEDKTNQYPSKQTLDKVPQKSFNEVQTSTNFDVPAEIILQDIAAQTDNIQYHPIET